MKRVHHDKGDPIFSQGDAADYVYFVEACTVKILLRDKRGKKKTLSYASVTNG